MEVLQATLEPRFASADALAPLSALQPHLVLVFAPDHAFADPAFAQQLTQAFPEAHRVGCSSAGEIGSDGVSQGSAVVTALRFKKPNFRVAQITLEGMSHSQEAGTALGQQLAAPDLDSILLFCPGVDVNGSALIEGLAKAVGPKVLLTGGLAGDDGKFQQTWTLCDDAAQPRSVVGVAFYGGSIQVSHGSFGGWQPFGPARRVTRCEGNVLYELDGQPALDIYRRYLGEYASGLPASGLLFPFSMLSRDQDEVGLIRTILGIDEATNALILAGEVDPNGYLRLMHASNDALVDGAEMAAQAALKMQNGSSPGLALLVSCVGRKLVMGERVDEEVEAVGAVLGSGATLTGFYSNGEISPYVGSTVCALHNQTMTITCLND